MLRTGWLLTERAGDGVALVTCVTDGDRTLADFCVMVKQKLENNIKKMPK